MFRREENSSHHESSPFNSGHPRGLKQDSLSRSALFPPFNRHALLTSATLLSVYSFFYTGPSLLFFHLPHTSLSLLHLRLPASQLSLGGGGRAGAGLGSFDGTVTASGEFWASDYFFNNTGETSNLQSLERGVLLLDGSLCVSVDYRVCIGHSPGCPFRPVLFSRVHILFPALWIYLANWIRQVPDKGFPACKQRPHNPETLGSNQATVIS